MAEKEEKAQASETPKILTKPLPVILDEMEENIRAAAEAALRLRRPPAQQVMPLIQPLPLPVRPRREQMKLAPPAKMQPISLPRQPLKLLPELRPPQKKPPVRPTWLL
jgi:hypothetical protein